MKNLSLKQVFLESRDITDFFEPHGLNDKQKRVFDSIMLAIRPKRAAHMKVHYPGYRKMYKSLTSEMMVKAIEKYFGLPGKETLDRLRSYNTEQAERWILKQMANKK